MKLAIPMKSLICPCRYFSSFPCSFQPSYYRLSRYPWI